MVNVATRLRALHRATAIGADSVPTRKVQGMPTLTLSRKAMASIPKPEAKPVTYFDTATVGFGLKCLPNGKRRWIVEYRPGAGGRGVATKRMVLGDARTVTIEDAREAARIILSKAQLGADPAQERSDERKSLTVAELLTKYQEQHLKPKKKASTDEYVSYLVNTYLTPEFGTKRASNVTRAEVARWHREIGATGKTATANRAIQFLAAAYAFGQRFGYLTSKVENPAKSIEKFREVARERFLNAEELARLGETLRLAETEGLPWNPDPAKKSKHVPKTNQRTVVDPFAVAAIRLLLFTGARRGEILNLEWAHVDLERGLLNLPDSKTGRKTIPLGGPAIELLKTLPRLGDGKRVIPGRMNDDGEYTSRVDLKKPWDRIRDHAKLDGLRLHDLRHSFAAVGAGSGLGLPTIGKLLGHKEVATTARYAHLADDPMRRAADSIAGTIAEALEKRAKS